MRLVVWDSRVPGLCPVASYPWISNNKFRIWASFRQKLTIGHKSTYSSFEKLIQWNFFRSTKFSLFDQVASFDLNFLASPEGYKKILSMGISIFLIDIENSIGLIGYFFLRDRLMSQVGVYSSSYLRRVKFSGPSQNFIGPS